MFELIQFQKWWMEGYWLPSCILEVSSIFKIDADVVNKEEVGDKIL